YPREGWYPLGAIAGYFDDKSFGGKRLTLLGNNMNFFTNDTTAMQLLAGSTYNFKASAQTVGTNQVFSLKVWEQGTGEPANWTVSGNAPAGALTQGSVLLLSYNSDVSFGNVAITNLDTQGAKIPPSSYSNGSYTGMEGTAVSFDGSKSFDPDGSIVSYEWDFGDGNSGTGVNPTHIYAQNGTYAVSLKVTDNDGLNAINSTTAIIKTARNTVTSSVNLIGNNNSEPIVLDNQAEIDITANNSSVSGYITLIVDTNITRLNGSVSIANSTFGIQTGEKALNRYVEVDSTGINKSNISSVNLTMSYTDEDISGFDENSLKVYWWNGSIWKSLYPKGMNYSNENGPIVIDIRRNLTANKLTVQLNHFSTFTLALVGTPSTTPTPPCNNCNGGGGGGGGGGASGENYSNIELTEKYDMQISKDALTSYRFTHKKNPIMFVNITGNTTMGIITVSEEVLKGTSSLVKTSPEGLVYKNVNIWVGTSGFATPKNIKEASIKFRVDNNWMSANNVTSSDIILVKWNGNSWIQLETRVLSKDDTSTFFEGKTNAFSPFAITVKMGGVTAKVPGPEIPQQVEVKAPDSDETPKQPAETAIITRIASSGISTWSAILIILIIIILIAMYFKWVKK
ncbi:MAG: PGF-pre-PGF domain-containing protein, partial [Candidatus Methanoperedens sp.]